jgi:hypothetical protein
MRSTCVVLIALLVACGDSELKHDASPLDASIDALDPDAPIDAPVSDGIAAARIAPNGTSLTLPIFRVTVTSVRPQIANPTNPAGFTIQAEQKGPALFVAVDPTTLTPPPSVGDVVSFTITGMTTTPERRTPAGRQRRATSLMDYSVFQTGTDVTPLIQDVSSATDLRSSPIGVGPSPFHYDATLVSVTGTVSGNPGISRDGIQSVFLVTAGSGEPARVNGPTALISGVDMASGCHITVPRAPASLFQTPGVEGAVVFNFEVNVYNASDYVLTDCPAPKVQAAFAQSATSVKLQFDRQIETSSVTADGTQFTFDNGLTATAATVSGKTVMLTTSPQSASANYTVTVANSVTDLRGSGVDASATTAMFAGVVPPAIVRINEVNANLSNGCQLIELRVVQGLAVLAGRLDASHRARPCAGR